MSEQHRRPMRGPGGPGGMMIGEKAKDFKGTLFRLLNYIGKYKMAVLVVLIFAVGSTVFNVYGPKVLSRATSDLFEGLVE